LHDRATFLPFEALWELHLLMTQKSVKTGQLEGRILPILPDFESGLGE